MGLAQALVPGSKPIMCRQMATSTAQAGHNTSVIANALDLLAAMPGQLGQEQVQEVFIFERTLSNPSQRNTKVVYVQAGRHIHCTG